ncbi:MAG: hypothetical protein JSR59_20190 [Proteobacteria bacterium]|nr:hypothetical protein [Pseudomonadota bacterium]
MKFVLVLIALYVLYWLLRRSLRGILPSREAGRAPPEPQTMLVCAHCGVHLPSGEALIGDGMAFCDEAHQRAYAQQHRA